jgi:hypothetical protein
MASASVSVASSAPSELVWRVLTDFDHWPDWSGFKSAKLEGPLAPGTRLPLTGNLGVKVVFAIVSVDFGRNLTLRQEGKTVREHSYTIMAAPSGGSRIELAITLGSLRGPIYRMYMPLFAWLLFRPIIKRLAAQSERLSAQ